MMRALACVALLACSAPAPVPTMSPSPADPQTEADWQARPLDPGPKSDNPAGTSGVVGAQLPGGAFKSSDGQALDMADATASEGAIIVFYRGHWCRQCRQQLAELEGARTALAERGFRVYAISTDAPEVSAELKKKLGLGFELLSDKGGLAIANWGVFTRVHELARPAVFVVAPGGRITYRYVSDSPADRPSVETILSEAAKSIAPE